MARAPQLEIYVDNAGEYRWRLKAANDKIIAVSGEGYKQKKDCEDGIASVEQNLPIAERIDLTGK